MVTILIICAAIIILLVVLLIIRERKPSRVEHEEDEKTQTKLDPARHPIRKWFI